MRTRHDRLLALVLVVTLVGCARAPGGTDTTTASLTAPSSEPTAPPTTRGDQTQEVQDIWEIPLFAPLEPGAYFIDPDLDTTTPLRVTYEVPVEGWSMWIGGVKFAGDGQGPALASTNAAYVSVSITTVTNVVSDGCSDHSHANPQVGSSVDALTTALADLAPFQVTSPPEDVAAYGYSGRYLELTVPNLPVEGSGDNLRFTGCTGGQLKSWVAPFDTEPRDAFYGYTGPGYTEEFWILDVEGTRLMIAAERSAGSPQEDVEELRSILDSIRIEP